MSNVSQQRAVQTSLGPLNVAFPLPTSTAPITSSGVLNVTLGTGRTLVIGPNATAGQGPARGLVRRCKILVLTNGQNAAWLPVAQGTAAAPAFTATGAATDGSLITGGSPAEEVSFSDSLDVWMTASAAATLVQITVVEQ